MTVSNSTTKIRILFIINPIAGQRKNKNFLAIIDHSFRLHRPKPARVFTQYQGHATELAQQAVGEFDLVVAVGGDGTVNEVGKALAGTDTTMAIIPCGSGNGLARHLNIPLSLEGALKLLHQPKILRMDTATINGQFFFNVAGIGFDGQISHLFAQHGKRGPLSYIQIILNEFYKYKSQTYQVEIDGKTFQRKAFLISFANSSQYGNNAFISPEASITDGLLDTCILHHFPRGFAPYIAFSLFDKTLHQTPYDEIIQGKKIHISAPKPLKGHLDGEPIDFGLEIDVETQPANLSMVTGSPGAIPSLSNPLSYIGEIPFWNILPKEVKRWTRYIAEIPPYFPGKDNMSQE